ncbi:hypothetical protein FHT77_004860 [Rhizobium sp. BK181]|uniref:hypothetical protein n=1 Tax=Rhizobium sp. BK181 TaxID=2587072 RepID=UPI00161F5EA3|nr:hypothetical protein [Rhizobium sp. BK181]MBB3318951.1 hypothetical protein [Rhizobium sp. BK181]
MSPTSDIIADLAERRRSTPRLRSMEVRQPDGGILTVSLTWASDERLQDMPPEQAINKLINAGLALNASPVQRYQLAGLSLRELAEFAVLLDATIRAFDEQVESLVPRPTPDGAVAVEVMVEKRWLTFALLADNGALKMASGDATRTRRLLARLGLNRNFSSSESETKFQRHCPGRSRHRSILSRARSIIASLICSRK